MNGSENNRKRIFLNDNSKDDFSVRFMDSRTNQLVTINNFSEIAGRGIIKAMITVGDNKSKYITIGTLKNQEELQKKYLKEKFKLIFETGKFDNLKDDVYNHIGDFTIITKLEKSKKLFINRQQKVSYISLGEPKKSNIDYVKKFLDVELEEERKRLQAEEKMRKYLQEARGKIKDSIANKSRKQFIENLKIDTLENIQNLETEDEIMTNWKEENIAGFKESIAVNKVINEVQRKREERIKNPMLKIVDIDSYLNEEKQVVTWADYIGTDLSTGKIIELKNCIQSKVDDKFIYTANLNRTDVTRKNEIGYMVIFQLPFKMDVGIKEGNTESILKLLSEDEKAPKLDYNTMTFLGSLTNNMDIQRSMPTNIKIRNIINQNIKEYEEIVKVRKNDAKTK